MAFVDAGKLLLPNRTILAVTGLKGTGKTEFALHGPAPIGYHRFDMASEGAIRKLRALRPGAIQVSTYDFERPLSKKEGTRTLDFDTAVVELATRTYNEFVADYRLGLRNGFKSQVIDDLATLWEIFRIARLGKVEQVPQERYKFVNWEFKKMLKESLENDCMLTVICPLKEQWIDEQTPDGKRKSFNTGKYVLDGFKKIDYLAGAMVRLYRKGDATDPEKTPLTDPAAGQFCAQFEKANDNGMLLGEIVNFTEAADAGIDNTFGLIMSMIFENTSVEDWL